MLSYLSRFDGWGTNPALSKNIKPLSQTDALLFGDSFFSETTRYATLVGRSYGEPIMSNLFDESALTADAVRDILSSMHSADTVIYFFWDICSAVKTNWACLIEHWDAFCYSGDDAIIYVNPNEVYLYVDMTLKRIHRLAHNASLSSEQGAQACGTETDRRALAIENLFKGFSEETQDDIYRIFHDFAEGLRTLEEAGNLGKDYIDLNKETMHALLTNIITGCKPYSPHALSGISEYFAGSAELVKKKTVAFYALLEKEGAEQNLP